VNDSTLFGKPIADGGLALSRPLASVVIAAAISCCSLSCRNAQDVIPVR
jgi:hypothetical protein